MLHERLLSELKARKDAESRIAELEAQVRQGTITVPRAVEEVVRLLIKD